MDSVTLPLGLRLGTCGFCLGSAQQAFPAHESPPLPLGTRYLSSSSDNNKASSIGSPKNSETPASTSGSQNTGSSHNKKKKAKLETKTKKKNGCKKGEESKTAKSNNKKKHKQGNEAIFAALIDVINEDDWPMIIRYSIRNPRNLEGWYPGESEWLAAHRMSQAFSAIPDNQWDHISDNGVISVPKLARYLVKKRMGQVEHPPKYDDLEEVDYHTKRGDSFGSTFEEDWVAEFERLKERLSKKASKPDESGGPPPRSG